MMTLKISPRCTQIAANVADVITPVSIYLKLRDVFPNSVLLESSDYQGSRNSLSFICFQPIAGIIANQNTVTRYFPNHIKATDTLGSLQELPDRLDNFLKSFEVEKTSCTVNVNGLFGYSTYDAIQYFESIKIDSPKTKADHIPELRYDFYKYIIAFNHFTNHLYFIENLTEGEQSESDKTLNLLYNRNVPIFKFTPGNREESNLTDEQYLETVKKGKEHCARGDVFQIVLSRQFSRPFTGDEFNVYRALRNINPSPYLFFFDYGNYKIFGSSPESQLVIANGTAAINPIAGTFKRTGDDDKDKELAVLLSRDPKENAEHVMLVDLARNDLSRNCNQVVVETYKEVQYYSHVIHLVSNVKGTLKPGANTCRIMADTFPAGTLSGAPKYKAMELINKIENQNRGFYGGCIGYIGFDGSFNQAILIRSFLSKNNTLYYQAGAGVVSESDEQNELKEVNNKLGALKKAIEMASQF